MVEVDNKFLLENKLKLDNLKLTNFGLQNYVSFNRFDQFPKELQAKQLFMFDLCSLSQFNILFLHTSISFK